MLLYFGYRIASKTKRSIRDLTTELDTGLHLKTKRPIRDFTIELESKLKNGAFGYSRLSVTTFSRDLTIPHLRRSLTFRALHYHTQGAEVTGQLRVNGKIRHLRRCTLEDQVLALKRKHRVHKYVNTATICVSVVN